MLKISWKEAAAWRVGRHHLDKRAPAGSLLTVASRVCGLHAQLMSSAELAAWARVEGLERRDVQRALWDDRSLIKTWAMRGTLHLLPAHELPLWYGALATSRRFLKPARWQKYFGITMEELDRLTEAIGTALHDRVMTREELAREVGRVMGSKALGAKVAEGSWGTILRPAAFSGRLCFGPSIGQRVQFTCPASWLSTTLPAIDHKDASADVARRFLAAYGPATYNDLARWWNGGGVATAKQWIASLGEEASAVEVDGTPAWLLREHVRQIRKCQPNRSVRLLPAFDPYVVGASWHADQLLPGSLRSRVYRPQGWISPVLLVNGFMQGVWRSRMKGDRVEVTVEPFINLAGWVRREAETEAERLATFLGGKLTFSWVN